MKCKESVTNCTSIFAYVLTNVNISSESFIVLFCLKIITKSLIIIAIVSVTDLV